MVGVQRLTSSFCISSWDENSLRRKCQQFLAIHNPRDSMKHSGGVSHAPGFPSPKSQSPIMQLSGLCKEDKAEVHVCRNQGWGLCEKRGPQRCATVLLLSPSLCPIPLQGLGNGLSFNDFIYHYCIYLWLFTPQLPNLVNQHLTTSLHGMLAVLLFFSMSLWVQTTEMPFPVPTISWNKLILVVK